VQSHLRFLLNTETVERIAETLAAPTAGL